MKKIELVTIEQTGCKGYVEHRNPTFRIKATQEYLPDAEMGHYKYVIEDIHGNILKVQSSSGAPREGKIDLAFLNDEMEYFLREYLRYQRYLLSVK